MIDYYLKAADQAALHAALVAADMATQDELGFSLFDGVNLDEIGIVQDSEGVSVPGYHANLRLSEEIGDVSVLPTIEEPDTPMRVWAS